MLFTQSLNSERDINVFPLLQQIFLFTLMQNINEIISQSKYHYRWMVLSQIFFYYCIFLWSWYGRAERQGERTAFHFNNM